MAAIAWYGPLIDLSKAYSHVDDFVQLLVFVHRTNPVHYKLSKGGEVIRTDIQVGDDTRPFFSVSLWQREIGSNVVSGDIILLQNVKITRFGDIIEARTIQCSSLLCLVHPYESLISNDVDELIMDSRLGATTKVKLRKVIEWAKRATSSLPSSKQCFQELSKEGKLSRNWKLQEGKMPEDCLSLSEVSRLSNSSKATFYASVGEIFLPFTWKTLDQFEKERMFISRRVFEIKDDTVAKDLICTGCQLCGSPFCLEDGATLQAKTAPLYCHRSRNFLHVAGFIYRPFMLYVWDETDCIPLLVTNKAAQLLFGNINAEKVHLFYRSQNPNELNIGNQEAANYSKDVEEGDARFYSQGTNKSVQPKAKRLCNKSPNFYLIWLILLKMVLRRENSPLKFEVVVNGSLDMQDGRFELESVSMPCLKS